MTRQPFKTEYCFCLITEIMYSFYTACVIMYNYFTERHLSILIWQHCFVWQSCDIYIYIFFLIKRSSSWFWNDVVLHFPFIYSSSQPDELNSQHLFFIWLPETLIIIPWMDSWIGLMVWINKMTNNNNTSNEKRKDQVDPPTLNLVAIRRWKTCCFVLVRQKGHVIISL